MAGSTSGTRPTIGRTAANCALILLGVASYVAYYLAALAAPERQARGWAVPIDWTRPISDALHALTWHAQAIAKVSAGPMAPFVDAVVHVDTVLFLAGCAIGLWRAACARPDAPGANNGSIAPSTIAPQAPPKLAADPASSIASRPMFYAFWTIGAFLVLVTAVGAWATDEPFYLLVGGCGAAMLVPAYRFNSWIFRRIDAAQDDASMARPGRRVEAPLGRAVATLPARESAAPPAPLALAAIGGVLRWGFALYFLHSWSTGTLLTMFDAGGLPILLLLGWISALAPAATIGIATASLLWLLRLRRNAPTAAPID